MILPSLGVSSLDWPGRPTRHPATFSARLMPDPAFVITFHGRRWLKLADAPAAGAKGWSPIVWTANEAHAERWLTQAGAADFAACNLRGDGHAIVAHAGVGAAFA
jgi:hypothetical protein